MSRCSNLVNHTTTASAWPEAKDTSFRCLRALGELHQRGVVRSAKADPCYVVRVVASLDEQAASQRRRAFGTLSITDLPDGGASTAIEVVDPLHILQVKVA